MASDNRQVVHQETKDTGDTPFVDLICGTDRYLSEVVLDDGTKGVGWGKTQADALSEALKDARDDD